MLLLYDDDLASRRIGLKEPYRDAALPAPLKNWSAHNVVFPGQTWFMVNCRAIQNSELLLNDDIGANT